MHFLASSAAVFAEEEHSPLADVSNPPWLGEFGLWVSV